VTRKSVFVVQVILGLVISATAGRSFAQPPVPGHSAAASAPLFVEDLPVGSISVRITHPSMTEPVVGVDVVGTWTTTKGKGQSATIKTGDDGRAIFTNIPPGSTFGAKATIEGKDFSTAEFTVPDQGGSRLLVVVGAEAAEAMNQMTGGAAPSQPAEPRTLGIRAGKIEPRDGTKAGTLELTVLAADGKPIPEVAVELGRPKHGGGGIETVRSVTDKSGVVHFENLESGKDAPYAAVIERDGMRVGTPAFVPDDQRGAVGEIRLPGKTSELSALRISSGTRMMVELREDAIAVLQNLVVENTSAQVFDPGPRGLFIPLPEGFTGGEKLPGGAEIDIKEGVGAFLHGLLPPAPSPGAVASVRVGYVLTTHGTSDFNIVQPMPLGLQGALVMVPVDFAVTLSAPGLQSRPAERDDNGNDLRMYEMEPVAPGQALRLTVAGLPARDHTGQWIAGVLAGLLVATGFVASRRPRQAAALGAKAG